MLTAESPSKLVRWGLVRVEPGHRSRVELLSGDFVRLSTHFYRRTLLCVESDLCPLCDVLPSRSYWYLPCKLLPSGRLSLLELSATSSADLEQHAKLLHGKLGYGITVELSRRKRRSPMRCEIVGDVLGGKAIAPQVWVSALMAIFGLGALREFETLEQYSARVIAGVIERGKLVRGQMEAGQRR